MLLPWIWHKLIDHSHCMSNIWSGTHHCVHQDTNFQDVWDFYHFYFVSFGCWGLTLKEFQVNPKERTFGFHIFHVEFLKNLLNVFFFRKFYYSRSSISYYPHDQDLFTASKPFISNSLDDYFFNLLISWMSDLTTPYH